MNIVVLTGGQVGGDIGVWDAAKEYGFKTSGYMLKGFRNLSGEHPEYEALYGAMEGETNSSRDRIERNILSSNAVLLLTENRKSESSFRTIALSQLHQRPLAIFDPNKENHEACAKSLKKLYGNIGPHRLFVVSHRYERYYDIAYDFMTTVFWKAGCERVRQYSEF